MLKLKKINFTTIDRTPIFLGVVVIKKVLVPNKVFLSEKNYKYFIGYLYNGNKVKPLNVILPKTSAYIKSYDGQTKRMYFFIRNDDY